MRYINESGQIPVKYSCDCVVVGGGIAGVAAALACARVGKDALLVEKTLMTGGLATQGFVNKYLPICDGYGHKMCGGISEELLLESVRYGYDTLPRAWRSGRLTEESSSRYMTVFSPYDYVMALDELLEKNKVDVLYDALFCQAHMDGKRVDCLIFEGKEGRFAVECGAVVDATGDCDVFCRIGSPYEEAGNWLTYWAYVASMDTFKEGLETASVLHGVPLWEKGAAWNGAGGLYEKPEYAPLSARSVSDFVMDGRRVFRDVMSKKPQRPVIAALPTVPQFRTTRRLKGVAELTRSMLNARIDDSIGCAPDWRTRGEVYEIPFGSLYCKDVENVLTAGRCISATGDTWEVTRAIPACSVTGQAAGAAAAIMLERGISVQDVPIGLLQRDIANAGGILHIADAMSL